MLVSGHETENKETRIICWNYGYVDFRRFCPGGLCGGRESRI